MEYDDKKKEIIKICFENNILVNPDFLNQLQQEDLDKVQQIILENKDITVLNKKIFEKQDQETRITASNVKILFNYKEESKKRGVQDFISYFNIRYKSLEKILKNRIELQDTLSISRISAKRDRDDVSLIGIVASKRLTKNENFLFELEDPSGKINIMVTKNRKEVYQQAKNIVEDEVIGIKGVSGDGIVFVESIYWPDVPINKPFKKAKEEGYAIFISDFHIGSKNFLYDKFNQFIKWINGDIGSPEQKELTKKIKYLFIAGDLVDGGGIYPGQEKDMLIKDIYEQHRECAKLLSQIPTNIPIIISPGNHDAMRIAEPQPCLYTDFAKSLYELPNTIMVSNPALVNIDATDDFEGFDVLFYHGYSFPYYADVVESIRNAGGLKRSDLIMKFLLQRRHLAPTHSSNLYIPDSKKDPLIIDTVPDFFVTGHIHTISASNYKNITMINSSCWMTQTKDQIKRGIVPEPARAVLVDLKTRKIKILRF